jgi:protein-S-isoprenylcysteine O-methyltransferase Ste14
VRHPGYAAAILLCVASGPALGSWISALPPLAAIPLVLWRMFSEERLLRDGLPGYEDYAAQVRARLVPGMW